MVEITSIKRIEKELYTEVIWLGEKKEERLAPVFAFYRVELKIDQENTVFEAEVRDGGWGREKPYITWDFEEQVYSLLTGKDYKAAHEFITETIFRTYLGEELQFPMVVNE
jgi:hypothetical protein